MSFLNFCLFLPLQISKTHLECNIHTYVSIYQSIWLAVIRPQDFSLNIQMFTIAVRLLYARQTVKHYQKPPLLVCPLMGQLFVVNA